MVTPKQIQRLAETELMRAGVEARRISRQLLWKAISVLVGILALVMLSLAAFYALSNAIGDVYAALVVGGALSALTLLTLFIANRPPSRAEQMERDMALRAVEEARDDLQRDFDDMEGRVDNLTGDFLGLFKGSKSAPLINLGLTLLAILSPSLRRFILPFINRNGRG